MKTTREALKTPIKVLLVTTLVIVLLGIGAFSVTKVGALQGSNGEITLEKATDIALKDAGFQKNEVSILKTKPDRDNGINKYDIEFLVDGIEYDYEIDATSGRIVKKELDREYANNTTKTDPAPSTTPTPDPAPNATPTPDPAPSTSYISVEEAKAKALKDAGLSSATYIKAELDRDDGIAYYDVEFKSGIYEYDYEINALTGAVIERDVDRDDD